jgi:methanogenic corrinoid protein MtbC1
MVSVICRLVGVPTRILGVNTPPEEIAEAAEDVSAKAVALSISLATGSVDTDRTLRSLKEMLRPETHLVVGGKGARGARRGPRGIIYFKDLEAFEQWLRDFKESPGGP